MKKTLMLLFFIAQFFGVITSLKATHQVSFELTYQCLNPATRQYRFIFHYTEVCPSALTGMTQTLNFESISGGCASFTALATQQGPGVDQRQQICPTQTTNCSGGAFASVMRYTMQVDVTLPAGCNWRVYTSNCCRATAITNLTSPDLFGTYIDITIDNNTGTCNNSPTFASQPILYACAGQSTSYNHGTIDIDGDSLVYQLIPPRDGTSPFNNLNYNAGMSSTSPLLLAPATLFGFNPQTGQMTFTPQAGTNQRAIVAVRIFEYRNGVLIGTYVRELQINVSSTCTNNNPATSPVSNINGSSLNGTTFSTCPGNTMTFRIVATDPDAGQVLTVTHNIAANLPGAVINVSGTNPVTLNVTWNVPANPLPNYTFTTTFTDDACPIQGIQILGFAIDIGANVNITADSVFCPPGPVVKSINAVANPGTFAWSPATGLSCTNCANPNATVSAPVTYTVTYTDAATGCSAVATHQFREHVMSLNVTPANPVLCLTPSCFDQTLVFVGGAIQSPTNINFLTSLMSSGGGTLTITYRGDLDAANESWAITNETPSSIATVGGVAGIGGCARVVTVNVPLTDADINTWIANGTISFVATPTNRVGLNECGNDTMTVRLRYCAPSGSSVNLSAQLNGDPGTTIVPNPNRYDVTTTAYSNVTTGTWTNVTLGDDQLSGSIPLGFNFTFYGNSFANGFISSNGFFTFDGAASSGCCSGQVIPGAGSPNNLIAMVWNDLYPPGAGTIRYQTTGTAPNRRFILQFNGIPRCCGTTPEVTTQLILFEGSNCIEIHTSQQVTTGTLTMGIENASGTLGVAVPGRNSSTWTVNSNEAYRFCPGNDTIGTGITYVWSPAAGVSSTTAQNVTVTPASVPSTYTVTASDGICTASRPVTITCTLLDVLCSGFTAKMDQDIVTLYFRTAAEDEISGFEVQRSADAINFENIGWVQGKGNSSDGHDYVFTDNNALLPDKTYYYRILAVEFDGSREQLCNIVGLNTESVNFVDLNIRPNPFSDKTEVVFNCEIPSSVEISIYDVLGHKVADYRFTAEAGINKFEIDLDELSAGTYLLQLNNERGTKISKQIVKY